MKDREKTETENAINRKLDALKAAVHVLAAEGKCLRLIMSPLERAWKEEEDD